MFHDGGRSLRERGGLPDGSHRYFRLDRFFKGETPFLRGVSKLLDRGEAYAHELVLGELLIGDRLHGRGAGWYATL